MLIKLHMSMNCPKSLRVFLMLEEKKIDFEVVPVDSEEAEKDRTYPILEERDVSIYNKSYALPLYIDERFPCPSMFSSDLIEKSEIMLFSDYIERNYFQDAHTRKNSNTLVKRESNRFYQEAESYLIPITKYISHNDFTFFDCTLIATFVAYERLGAPITDKFPRLLEYRAKAAERSSVYKILPKKTINLF